MRRLVKDQVWITLGIDLVIITGNAKVAMNTPWSCGIVSTTAQVADIPTFRHDLPFTELPKPWASKSQFTASPTLIREQAA